MVIGGLGASSKTSVRAVSALSGTGLGGFEGGDADELSGGQAGGGGDAADDLQVEGAEEDGDCLDFAGAPGMSARSW